VLIRSAVRRHSSGMRALALVAVVGLLVGFTPPGAEVYRGTITSVNPSPSRNNATTTHTNGTFKLNPGSTYTVYCDIASTYRTTDTSGTAAVSTDLPIPAGQPFRVTMPRTINASLLWTLPVAAGTSNCSVYEVLE
jgi:hypothetical protein